MPDTQPTPQLPEACLNCSTAVGLEFCPACGQRRGDHRRSVWRLLGDFFREVLELDGRTARTLRALLRPGRLTREYNAGRRQRYTSPVRLYLFASIVLFATAGIRVRAEAMLDPPDPNVGTTELGDAEGPSLDDGSMLGRIFQERLDELRGMTPAKRDKELLSGALENGPLVMVTMLPIFALLLELVFLGTRRLYVEHLVFSLHVHSVWFLLAIPALAIPSGWGALFLVPIPFYTIAALQHAYAASWWATLLRTFILGLAYTIALAFGLAMAFGLGLLFG